MLIGAWICSFSSAGLKLFLLPAFLSGALLWWVHHLYIKNGPQLQISYAGLTYLKSKNDKQVVIWKSIYKIEVKSLPWGHYLSIELKNGKKVRMGMGLGKVEDLAMSIRNRGIPFNWGSILPKKYTNRYFSTLKTSFTLTFAYLVLVLINFNIDYQAYYLKMAVKDSNYLALELLTSVGANPNTKIKNNLTPYEFARLKGDKRAIKILRGLKKSNKL